ncbi:MAG: recombination mediator RecR [Myxococcota bacterium]
MRSSPPIDRLVNSLKRLPGIGEKTATRLAFYLLGAADNQVQALADAIGRLKQEIVLCEQCFDLTDHSPCQICLDPKREPNLLCVVEEPADLAAIEKSASFRGHYHVLGGAFAPIDGVGPDELRVHELLERVRGGEIEEVVLATNPNTEGDATAHYLAGQLRESGVKLSRIAYGMPLGGDLEYADHVTVGLCIENRRGL